MSTGFIRFLRIIKGGITARGCMFCRSMETCQRGKRGKLSGTIPEGHGGMSL
ncbi:hypothetical protein [Selenomonas artemidis]|uniref:hypothetical protein n=1 Tax=Selenomonas artemidis TaxID=671224 RepID=UPI000410823E|nr:hypothetical protein [Selenomonas artemidis]